MKLLVVDTDYQLVEMLAGWLKTRGYEVLRANTGEQAKLVWAEEQPDLVVLDTALRDVEALSMCQEMRKMHDALLIVLTDEKDVQHEILCLESGADDYLRKPILPAQLLARIHAVSRRPRSRLSQDAPSIITIGSLRVDVLSHEVSVDGKAVHLSPIEGKLLHLLAVHVNTVCTASQIVSYIWGAGNERAIRSVRVYICRLRKKLEPNPGDPCYILTLPEGGYGLESRPSFLTQPN